MRYMQSLELPMQKNRYILCYVHNIYSMLYNTICQAAIQSMQISYFTETYFNVYRNIFFSFFFKT